MTPRSADRPYRRALLLAFVPCVLWEPLTIALQRFLGVSNDTTWMLSGIPILAASRILYQSRLFPGKHPAARAGMALLMGSMLFGCAVFAWVVLFLLLLKCTGECPFPI